MRVSEKELKRRDGHVTEDERRSIITALFNEEKDNAQMLADVSHPYAGCNTPGAQHDTGGLPALINIDDEYDGIF